DGDCREMARAQDGAPNLKTCPFKAGETPAFQYEWVSNDIPKVAQVRPVVQAAGFYAIGSVALGPEWLATHPDLQRVVQNLGLSIKASAGIKDGETVVARDMP